MKETSESLEEARLLTQNNFIDRLVRGVSPQKYDNRSLSNSLLSNKSKMTTMMNSVTNCEDLLLMLMCVAVANT